LSVYRGILFAVLSSRNLFLAVWMCALLLCGCLAKAERDASSAPSSAETNLQPQPDLSGKNVLVGRVVGIADGDSGTVLVGTSRYRIRLSAIDAPEKGQPFSQAAKNNLSRLIFGRQITLSYSKIDRYGRLVGKVIVDGVDVNLAWHYKEFAREQSPEDRQNYAEAEIRARNAKRGLWSEPDPLPPWQKRHANPPPE
jgi:endonuclease YncB( thermonuclease family)